MNHKDQDADFDKLDEMVREALGAEVVPERLERLTLFWQQQSQVDRRKRQIRVVTLFATVAATVLVSATTWWYFQRTSGVQPGEQPEFARSDTPASGPSKINHPAVPENGDHAERVRPGVRPANHYERFLFVARSRHRAESRQRLAAKAMDELIAALAADESADPGQLLRSSNMAPELAEQILLQKLADADQPHRQAILELVGQCGSEQAVTALLRLGRIPAWRGQALQTIEKVAGTAGLAQAARQSGDAAVRAAIYRQLLQDESTVEVYLSLVRDGHLGEEALSVARSLNQSLINALLARLDAEDRETRLAAALVLGRANGPVITDALIAFIAESPSQPTEAWIALLACRGPQVDRFMAYAAYQPKLLGPINRARMYWARLLN